MNERFRENPSDVATAARPGGFALVVTLSLMVLLTIIAVGLLTLSAVNLRASSLSTGMATARANARMALILAIGELQKQTGPDTRITARADVLDESNPPVLGVWRSWEGEDHETSGGFAGRPVSPGDYRGAKQDHFLTWLVSGDPSQTSTLPDTASGAGKATLVGENTIGAGDGRSRLQIHLTPELVVNAHQEGACAWWVSGENQKARLPKPYETDPDNSGRWATNLKSHSVADPEPFRMDSLLADPAPAEKAITRNQADLVALASTLPVSQEFFHDLSTTSVGLLTNVATGGWKKDLSLLTENWTRAGTRNLPFFRVIPGRDIDFSLPTTGSPVAPKSMLYPWASYRGGSSDMPIYQHGAVTSWENLRDYVTTYQNLSITSSGRGVIPVQSEAIDGNTFKYLHRVRVLPVIARIQWVFSHFAIQAGSTYRPCVLVNPVITMWNPYNLEVSFSSTPLAFRIPKPLPVALKYTIGGSRNTAYHTLTAGSTNYPVSLYSGSDLNYQITGAISLKPGETRVFSPTAPAPAGTTLTLVPGYHGKAGHYFVLKNNAGTALANLPGGTTIQADAIFDAEYLDVATNPGVGIYLDMSYAGRRHLAYRMIYAPDVARSIYPDVRNLAASPSLSSVATNPTPFLTTIFGARMASRTHLAAKGFVQSSPLVNYTAMGGKDLAESTIKRHYHGTNHPVNSPFDYSFEKVAPAGDSLLPNENDSTNRGYIITGFTKADGLSRCVIDELPTRPLVSLAELQNWDLRYDNPIPPFAFNLIGNSDASPLLPPDAVFNASERSLSTNLQYDDSYCANHLLFDDWFFSSIATDPVTFGRGGRNAQKAYAEFLTGDSALGNHAYQPIPADTAIASRSSSAANSLSNQVTRASDAWQTVASHLEIEGMFNVNSTSVTAWRALLGHARNQKIPYVSESGSSWSVDLSEDTDYAVSRFSVAGDVEAGESGSSGAFPEAAEIAGYRVFDDRMLDALASEIVKQVRLRGPFLSLSEFVNRQLSSGEPALAGAVQTALNKISEIPATNPFSGITSVISRTASANPPSVGDAEYQFPEAAVGQSTYGLPGYIRQADILRPLAPILNARDDTFTIRAYGDARDQSGKVTATAVCEAVVRRTREYVDPADAPDITDLPKSSTNQRFGRRYQVVSFRWLNAGEI